MTPPRAPRSDGLHNRAALLDAAGAAYAEHGFDASIADIARRAGVAKATVFHHFASKDALLAAVLVQRLQKLLDLGERLLEAEEPGAALMEFLALSAQQRQQNDLAFARTVEAAGEQMNEVRDRMFTVLDALVLRAQEAGAVRRDVTGMDVALLMCAPTHVAAFAPNAEPDLWRRYLAIILDGLHPQGAGPLPGQAPPRH
ncbi:TetR/AcrR family transcriptional regulator [Streptomyces hydrogenans]